MQLVDILRIGDSLELVYHDGNYKTSVQDVLDDGRFLVSEPTNRTVPVRVAPGSRVWFIRVRPDCIYKFFAVMDGLDVSGPLRMVRFKVASEIFREQRRAFYRLPIDISVIVDVAEVLDGTAKSDEVQTRTSDISEGGISFFSERRYAEGTLLTVRLALEDLPSIALECYVVRVMEFPDAGFRVSVRFIDCPGSYARELGKFIVAEQIRRRRIG